MTESDLRAKFEAWWHEIEGFGLRAERFTTPHEAAIATLQFCHALLAPESSGWQPIATAPEGDLVVVLWMDPTDPEHPERHDFDYLEEGVWAKHSEEYEHFLCVAPPGSEGPSEKAPYTHWMPLPKAPAAIAAMETKHATE